MSRALVIIDIQNDYFKGGEFELVGAQEAASNAKILLEKFRERNLPIFHIQHISIKQGATFFLPDTNGVKIYDKLTPKEGENVVIKHFPDSFLQTDLQSMLEYANVKDLVICGMMSHMCIDTTVRSAKAKNYDIILVHDACATRNLEFNGENLDAKDIHNAFMASLNGAFAKVVSTNEILQEI